MSNSFVQVEIPVTCSGLVSSMAAGEWTMSSKFLKSLSPEEAEVLRSSNISRRDGLVCTESALLATSSLSVNGLPIHRLSSLRPNWVFVWSSIHSREPYSWPLVLFLYISRLRRVFASKIMHRWTLEKWVYLSTRSNTLANSNSIMCSTSSAKQPWTATESFATRSKASSDRLTFRTSAICVYVFASLASDRKLVADSRVYRLNRSNAFCVSREISPINRNSVGSRCVHFTDASLKQLVFRRCGGLDGCCLVLVNNGNFVAGTQQPFQVNMKSHVGNRAVGQFIVQVIAVGEKQPSWNEHDVQNLRRSTSILAIELVFVANLNGQQFVSMLHFEIVDLLFEWGQLA
ncbi:hypothetical protein OGATHE_003175 [Ogataea polymorpha]|uniref:Uncharacterized protein n=1 Tax=Ogataea polymorpha TaxID=460523 RepID=A0A9P8P944_9ASCO|nr:hypothetical protein OGATHE_003175 [Ogataea polymorpha]